MSRVRMVAAALLALTGTFMLGRTTAPTKTIERVRTVEVAAKATTEQKTASALSSVAVDQGVRWRERIVYRPGGITTVIRTVEKKDERKATEAAAASSSATIVETRTVDVERLKVVESAKPNWSIGAAAGVGLDRRLRCQGDVGRRIVGGLWVTVGADVASRAALVGLRMEF